MRVIVTGGTGFLGRHLVWHLARKGCDVCFTGRNAEAARLIAAAAAKPVSFVPVEHGAAQAGPSLRALAKSADAMVHCAALSSPWGSVERFEAANVASARQVLEACRANDVPRLVHISTPSLYFSFADRLDIRETDPLPAPVNTYAATKLRAEQILAASALEQLVILRPRALFGPWDNTLMPRFLRVMERGSLPLPNGGRALLDLTYVDNAVFAIWQALTQPLPGPRCIYNVSNGEPMTLAELIARLQSVLKLPVRTRPIPYWLLDAAARTAELHARLTSRQDEPLLTRYSAGTLAFSQTLNLDSIRSELHYQPQVAIEQGMALYADWLQRQKGGANAA